MTAPEELEYIALAMKMTPNYISSHLADFRILVINLQMSHADTGLFGITSENEGEFFRFADWLRMLNESVNAGISDNDISTFEISASTVAEESEQLRNGKADGNEF